MAHITIYTDGGASGNPGPGGYGALLMYGEHEKEMSAGFRLTTNNRMELLAVIVALEALKQPGMEVEVYSDSSMWWTRRERMGHGLERKNFKARKSGPLKRFLKVYRQHRVAFHWVKGHAGNPNNERVDALAVSAYQTGNLGVDEAYESTGNV